MAFSDNGSACGSCAASKYLTDSSVLAELGSSSVFTELSGSSVFTELNGSSTFTKLVEVSSLIGYHGASDIVEVDQVSPSQNRIGANISSIRCILNKLLL